MHGFLAWLLQLLRLSRAAPTSPYRSPLPALQQERLLRLALALEHATASVTQVLARGYDGSRYSADGRGAVMSERQHLERALGAVQHEMMVLWMTDLDGVQITQRALELAVERDTRPLTGDRHRPRSS